MDRGAAAFGKLHAPLGKAEQFGQFPRLVGRVTGLKEQAATGRLEYFRESAVTGLNDRHAIGEGFENVQAFRFAVNRRDRQHVE